MAAPTSDASVQTGGLLPVVSIKANSLLRPLSVQDTFMSSCGHQVISGAVCPLSSYTTVLREEPQSGAIGVGAWPSVGVSGPTKRVLLSMESSLS